VPKTIWLFIDDGRDAGFGSRLEMGSNWRLRGKQRGRLELDWNSEMSFVNRNSAFLAHITNRFALATYFSPGAGCQKQDGISTQPTG
jgi:hypothetical protein